MIAKLPKKSPAADGLGMPAEWAPHVATWIAWPHQARDWPGKLTPVLWAFGEIARRLAPGEQVRILIEDVAQARRVRRILDRVGAPAAATPFFTIPTDRAWARDYGWFFLTPQSPAPQKKPALLHCGFTGWAKYPNHILDAQVPKLAAAELGARRYEAPIVLEGGAVDVNGRGSLLTTEECLLDTDTQVRNPGLDRAGYEAALASLLGARNVIWLNKGIAGDDTHGHVDDLARFVSPKRIVLVHEPNGADVNHRPLEENRERLESARLENGSKPEVIRLPMPEPLHFDGIRLPASYANFYIGNAAVLVPTFNDPHDREALGILADCFPDRPVVGIHAVDLVWGFGTLHCLTQQQPR